MKYSLAILLGSSIAASAKDVPCLPCIDRQNVKIGVVHHGQPSTDVYWGGMNDAIAQGASDMNINLIFNSTANEGLANQSEINERMITLIEEYCGSNQDSSVNAILVSLPDSSIVPSVNVCKLNKIPIAAFNAGPDIAVANDILFYGVNETLSGYLAGDALAKVDSTEKFCCSNHARGVDVLADRCGGMMAGVEANLKSNTFDVTVNPNDCAAWEEAIISGGCTPDEGKDWSTIGLYLAGKANHKCGVQFLEKYPDTYATASDVSEALYAGMTAGLNVLFGSDQQSYLQGYMPFASLTLAVTNNQMIENTMIETGPRLITEPPRSAHRECKSNNYEVCERAVLIDPTEPSPETPAEESPTPSSRALSQITADYTITLHLLLGASFWLLDSMILD